jgi:polyisoprenoid-binding protein YceI
MHCCYFQGSLQTDVNGAYGITTVKPGTYKGESVPPPAHIHVAIRLPAGYSDCGEPGTEIVFADDPYLPPNAEDLDYTIVRLEQVADDQGEYWVGEANIILGVDPAVKPAGSLRSFRILPEGSETAYHITEQFADLATITNATAITSLIEGEIQLDLKSQPVVQAVEMTVDLRGLKSDDPNRDEKLADRWVVTNRFPYATFVSTGIRDFPVQYREGEAVSFALDGDLTIRDVTRPVTFQVQASLEGDTLAGSAQASILMSDFGIDPPSLLGFVTVEDEVEITVRVTAVEGKSQ